MRAIQNLKYLFYLLDYQLIYFGPKSQRIKHTGRADHHQFTREEESLFLN